MSMEEQINTSVQQPTSAPVESEVQASLGAADAVEVVVNMEENMNADSGDDENVGAVVSVASGSGTEFTAKNKKRGRPKKEVSDVGQPEVMVAPEVSATPQKRGRGRPKGTGKWQTLAASFGCIAVGASGSNFTPHTMTVQAGENICQKIWSISQSQRGSDSICVLSASGTVSIAEILQHGSLGDVVRYEGRFDIVTLTGSHIYNERGIERCRVTRLSVQLAYPDGRLFGGAVVGSLIAADPVQLVVATFKQNTRELTPMVRQSPKPHKQRTVATVASPALATNGKSPLAEEITLTNAEHNCNQTTISPFSAPPTDETEKVVSDPDENRASPLAVDGNSSP